MAVSKKVFTSYTLRPESGDIEISIFGIFDPEKDRFKNVFTLRKHIEPKERERLIMLRGSASMHDLRRMVTIRIEMSGATLLDGFELEVTRTKFDGGSEQLQFESLIWKGGPSIFLARPNCFPRVQRVDSSVDKFVTKRKKELKTPAARHDAGRGNPPLTGTDTSVAKEPAPQGASATVMGASSGVSGVDPGKVSDVAATDAVSQVTEIAKKKRTRKRNRKIASGKDNHEEGSLAKTEQNDVGELALLPPPDDVNKTVSGETAPVYVELAVYDALGGGYGTEVAQAVAKAAKLTVTPREATRSGSFPFDRAYIARLLHCSEVAILRSSVKDGDKNLDAEVDDHRTTGHVCLELRLCVKDDVCWAFFHGGRVCLMVTLEGESSACSGRLKFLV